VPHISLVFREMWDATAARLQTLVHPRNSRVEICGIPHLAKNQRGVGHPASVDRTDLNGEGRRRSAGSGAAKHACCDSIRNQLPVDVGDGKGEAGAGAEIRSDGNRGDGTKALPKRARRLAQRRSSIRGSHTTHDAGMSPMSAAANGQQLLRCGERGHRRQRQQCPENAQQHKCCKPPHAVSVQQLQWLWVPHVPPDFLSRFVALSNYMRLSAKKAAHAADKWGSLQEIRVAPAYVGPKKTGRSPSNALPSYANKPLLSNPNTPHSPFAV